MPQIAVRLSDDELREVDAAVAAGYARSRAEAVRAGLELLRKKRRSEEIAEEYRRAYAEHPQGAEEDAWGEASIRAAVEDW